jgi:hypothetical protein
LTLSNSAQFLQRLIPPSDELSLENTISLSYRGPGRLGLSQEEVYAGQKFSSVVTVKWHKESRLLAFLRLRASFD